MKYYNILAKQIRQLHKKSHNKMLICKCQGWGCTTCYPWARAWHWSRSPSACSSHRLFNNLLAVPRHPWHSKLVVSVSSVEMAPRTSWHRKLVTLSTDHPRAEPLPNHPYPTKPSLPPPWSSMDEVRVGLRRDRLVVWCSTSPPLSSGGLNLRTPSTAAPPCPPPPSTSITQRGGKTS